MSRKCSAYASSLLLLVLSIAVAPIVESRAAVDDPAARALYEAFLDTIRSAQTLSWESVYDFSGGGPEGRCSYRIWLKKPGFGRMEATMPNLVTGQGDIVTGVVVGDGETFWIFWPAGFPGTRSWDPGHTGPPTTNLYMQRNFTPERYSFSHDSVRLGACMIMLAFQPSVFHGQQVSPSAVDAVTKIGTSEIDGQLCDGVLASMADGQRTTEYWIARSDRLPRRVKTVAHAAQDITAEESWTAVHRNEEMPDSLLRWTPPEGYVEYFEPSMESGLLPIGAEAPDFTAPLLGGGSFRLSENRGKVVLLNFWRIGCPPCRQELPILEGLHRKLRGAGLVMVGYDAIDDPARISALLRKSGVSYPCVWDTTRAIRETRSGYESGRMTGDPLTYLIGRDGKVAARWYGYSGRRPSAHTSQSRYRRYGGDVARGAAALPRPSRCRARRG